MEQTPQPKLVTGKGLGKKTLSFIIRAIWSENISDGHLFVHLSKTINSSKKLCFRFYYLKRILCLQASCFSFPDLSQPVDKETEKETKIGTGNIMLRINLKPSVEIANDG